MLPRVALTALTHLAVDDPATPGIQVFALHKIYYRTTDPLTQTPSGDLHTPTGHDPRVRRAAAGETDSRA